MLINIVKGVLVLIVSVLISTVVVIASIPLRLENPSKFRYLTFAIVTVLLSLVVVFGTFLNSKV